MTCADPRWARRNPLYFPLLHFFSLMPLLSFFLSLTLPPLRFLSPCLSPYLHSCSSSLFIMQAETHCCLMSVLLMREKSGQENWRWTISSRSILSRDFSNGRGKNGVGTQASDRSMVTFKLLSIDGQISLCCTHLRLLWGWKVAEHLLCSTLILSNSLLCCLLNQQM